MNSEQCTTCLHRPPSWRYRIDITYPAAQAQVRHGELLMLAADIIESEFGMLHSTSREDWELDEPILRQLRARGQRLQELGVYNEKVAVEHFGGPYVETS